MELRRLRLVPGGLAESIEQMLARPGTDAASKRAPILDPNLGQRVVRDGKFLALAGHPFRVRGVTYGSFLARPDGELYPPSAVIRADFEAMAALGLNMVRVYTTPPSDLLELAREAGLRVIAGLHYRDWRFEPSPGASVRRRVLDEGRRAIATALERCAGRPEVLALAVGNEVPGDMVRLHGIGAVEDSLGHLVEEVHRGDPNLLATYCNYPTTEYLQIPGQDLACMNVFLEDRRRLRAYLRHLQVVTADLPLVITELGLASELHGEHGQARSLTWQLETVDESGCAGAAIFSWTDEWAVGGKSVEGWGFGICDAQRRPKLAVHTARLWAARDVRQLRERWPSISVVICAYNAASTIAAAVESAVKSDYPALEVIVCDDGSSDGTAHEAARFPVRILHLDHGGLSAARNAGIAAAAGEIVAFLDADAACHPEWPYHLALAMAEPRVQAAGGPNLPFEDAGVVERAVAKAPGSPVEVLLSDDRAEHVPGCNMAFRKQALLDVGGFDPVYVAAGDDVDVCWKLLDKGEQIAFSPAAQVHHHRRATLKGFLRQQIGYGRAERMVSRRHSHRFNRLGQARWAGSIYGYPRFLPGLLRPVVYHGSYGLAPYQSIVQNPAQLLVSYLVAWLPLVVPLALLGLFIAFFSPVGLALTGLTLLSVLAFWAAMALAVKPERQQPHGMRVRLLAASLYILQPLARVWGRLRGVPEDPLPKNEPPPWTGDRASWLVHLERQLARRRCGVSSSRSDSRWDLRVSIGLLITCRITTAVAWSWFPLCRRSFVPRPTAWALLIVGNLLTLLQMRFGPVLLAVFIVGSMVETLWLDRLVDRALLVSTGGVPVATSPTDLGAG